VYAGARPAHDRPDVKEAVVEELERDPVTLPEVELPAELTVEGETFRVRRAVAADVPTLVRLLASDSIGVTRERGNLEPYERAFAAIEADPAQLLVVVTSGSGEVVGTLQLSFIPGLARQGALRAQIEAVRVDEVLRGRGVGRALLEWAIAAARRRGCGLVQLTSDKRRCDAHRFYEQLGFEASHVGFKLRLA
jgi:GNAT superfamily N-acetyltransferase